MRAVLEFEDCGEHCRSWEFPNLGLDRHFVSLHPFARCSVVHWPNGNYLSFAYLRLARIGKIQQAVHQVTESIHIGPCHRVAEVLTIRNSAAHRWSSAAMYPLRFTFTSYILIIGFVDI